MLDPRALCVETFNGAAAVETVWWLSKKPHQNPHTSQRFHGGAYAPENRKQGLEEGFFRILHKSSNVQAIRASLGG